MSAAHPAFCRESAVGRGLAFGDFDNDGDLDIMVANGYISGNPKDEYFTKLANAVTAPNFDPTDAMNWPVMGDSTFSGYEPKRVFHNEGNGTFRKDTTNAIARVSMHSWDHFWADYDNDGDVDLFVANQHAAPQLSRNQQKSPNHWLMVRLLADPATGITRR